MLRCVPDHGGAAGSRARHSSNNFTHLAQPRPAVVIPPAAPMTFLAASLLALALAAPARAYLSLGQTYPAGASEVNVSDPVKLPIFPSYPAYQSLVLLVRARAVPCGA